VTSAPRGVTFSGGQRESGIVECHWDGPSRITQQPGAPDSGPVRRTSGAGRSGTRRRQGRQDEAPHCGPHGRREHRLVGGSDRVPAELSDLVERRVRGVALTPEGSWERGAKMPDGVAIGR